MRSTEEGGPPPWIPFGKKIIKVSEHDKNFKALAEKRKSLVKKIQSLKLNVKML